MLNILCVSRYFKGSDFLRAIQEEGHNAYLVTSSKLENEPWPWECISEKYYMVEDEEGNWNMPDLINGLAYTMRSLKFDIMVSLDDFDVEITAHLREYFRVAGMGETTARYFRDKLAMRIKAKDSNIPVPDFTALFHDADIRVFTEHIPAPWLLKPRGQASATGITKLYSADELWTKLEELGDKRHAYLVEKFAPGDVYHVDALTYNGKVIFAKSSQYLSTPFEVAHGGGIFRSVSLSVNSWEDQNLKLLNEQIMKSFGMVFSASHTEFIKGADGKYFFLETSSRVGGAHLSDMVEAATGLNLWTEWAKIEIAAHTGKKYKMPKVQDNYAGIIVSLSKFEHPDMSSFSDPEVAWKIQKKHHVGLIVKSPDHQRVIDLLDDYAVRIKNDFHASLPAPDRPSN
ncbi:MAG: ATPase [Saprospiraceae bacterium]|nr:ATPase [Saprospiraceae bacterium]